MNIPIFLSSDNNYAPLIGTVIISICKNTKFFCDFYILDGGISTENKKKIIEIKQNYKNFNVAFIEINNSEIFKNIESKRNLSLAAFSRLLIPYIKPELNKAIYLDVDLILLDDINKLFSIDISEKSLAATPEFLRDNYYDELKKRLGISQKHKMFNSGALLLNCENWRNKYIFEDFLTIEKDYRDRIVHNDQDILNICFENDYYELPYQYNYNQTYSFAFSPEYIIIRHFNGIKPYNFHKNTVSSLMPFCETFWEIAQESPFYDYFLSQSCTEKQTQQLLKQLQFLKFQYTEQVNFISLQKGS